MKVRSKSSMVGDYYDERYTMCMHILMNESVMYL